MSTNVKNAESNPRQTQIAIALRNYGGDVARAITSALDTCMSCEHFDEATELCALAQARPPARVIAYGCPEYLPEVPF